MPAFYLSGLKAKPIFVFVKSKDLILIWTHAQLSFICIYCHQDWHLLRSGRKMSIPFT